MIGIIKVHPLTFIPIIPYEYIGYNDKPVQSYHFISPVNIDFAWQHLGKVITYDLYDDYAFKLELAFNLNETTI